MSLRGVSKLAMLGIARVYKKAVKLLLIERILEHELSKNNIDYSAYKIRKALNELQYSEIEIEGEKLYLRSKVEGIAYEILRALRIKIPPPLCSPDFFSIYFWTIIFLNDSM